LNYAGKFDATFSVEGRDTQHSPAYVHVDSIPAHAPADAIIVSDAHLLFHGDFKRSGVDLILSDDGREVVLHDYFKGDKRASLASADGAHLTGSIVDALTGHVHVAQAGGMATASQVIGHVTKLQGSATVIRNGVSVILNMGDNVEKGDVVQTAANSTLGLTFIDGTVFGLSSNARMVLNEMVYDPNGSNNSSLLSLVAGTISFVAGETAKHGDMKVDTPVATMGIRGTAVLVEIDFSVPQSPQPGQTAPVPNASFQVLVEPDGTTGSYILFDKTTLQPIAVVNVAGQQVNINNGVVTTSQNQLSPDIQKLILDVFTQKFTQTDQNTKVTSVQTDTINPQLTQQTITTKDGTKVTANFTTTGDGGNSNGNNPQQGTPGPTIARIDGPPQVAVPAKAFTVTERAGITNDTNPLDTDTAGGTVAFQDPNKGDAPTVTAAFVPGSAVYLDAKGHDITASLNALQLKDVGLLDQIALLVVPDAGNNNNGSATFLYSIHDNLLDFLGEGEKLTLTYNITVNNNFGPNPEPTVVPITITFVGTNDKPVITTDAQTQLIEFAAGTSTKGGPLQVLNNEQTSGTFAFTDVDLTDTHQIVDTKGAPSKIGILTNASLLVDGQLLNLQQLEQLAPTPMAAFEQALQVDVQTDSTGTGNGTLHWQLTDLPVYLADFIPAGQTLTLTYTITVMDSQGATDTKTVEVTITGANNPAEVWIHTTTDGNDKLWTTATNWEKGTVPVATDDVIIITDQLAPNTPAYPVQIDGKTSAVANSVTMNDFLTYLNDRPELDVAKGGSLTIGVGGANPGGLTLSADSILSNAGTITLGNGGVFQDQASVTNTGTIEVQGGTLNILLGIQNAQGESFGNIIVDKGAKLKLGAVSEDVHGGITGGAVTINGELDLQGGNFLNGGTLVNNNQINVTGIGNALHNENVTANNALEIKSGGALTIDQGSQVTNTLLTVDDGAQLTLNDAALHGGTINDGTATGTGGQFGKIDVTGNSTIDGGASLNNGGVTVESNVALTLDNVTVNGTTFTDTATGAALSVDSGDTLTLQNGATVTGGSIVNAGTLHIETSTGAKLDGVSVTGGGAIIVDVVTTTTPATLKLDDGTTITGGTLNIGKVGTLDVEAGTINGQSATLEGVDVVADATSTIAVGASGAAKMTLEGSSTVTGGKMSISAVSTLAIGAAAVPGTHATLYHVAGSDPALGYTVAPNSEITVDAQGHVTSAIIQFVGQTTQYSLAVPPSSEFQNLENNPQLSQFVLFGSNNRANVVVSTTTLDLTNPQWVANLYPSQDYLFNPDIGQQYTNLNLTITPVLGATLDGVNVAGTNANSDAGTPASTIAVGATGAATLTVDDGTIISDGALTIASGSMLDVERGASGPGATLNGVHVTATDATGTIAVGFYGAATLTLNGTTITGGAINEYSVGSNIDVTGASKIVNASLNNGAVTVDAALTLDGTTVSGTTITDNVNGSIELDNTVQLTGGATIKGQSSSVLGAITNLGTLEISGPATLLNDTLTNTNHTVQVDASKTLTINGLTLNGGQLTNNGIINSTGSSAIHNANITNNGLIESTAGTLTIDAAVQVTLTNAANATLEANGGELDLTTEPISNAGTIQAINGGTVKLSTGVTNTGNGNVTAAAGATVDFINASVSGGTLGGAGTIATAGTNTDSTLNGVTIDSTTKVTSAVGTMDLTGIITNNGEVDANGGTVDLENATVTGGTLGGSGTVDVVTASTLNGSATLNVQAVTAEAKLTLDTMTVSGTTITDKGGGVETDNNVKLTGGATLKNGTVTNLGTLEIAGAATLLADKLANGSGTVQVDNGQTLTLNGAELSGGAINNHDGSGGGTIDVNTAASKIDGNATLTGGAVTAEAKLTLDTMTVSGTTITDKGGGIETDNNVKLTAGATLEGQSSLLPGTITNLGTLEVAGTATLSNDTVTNTNHTVQVDAGQTLKLDNSTINAGNLTVDGELDSTGISFLTGVTISNISNIKTVSGTLTIDPASFTNTGTIEVDIGSTLVLSGETVTNSNQTTKGTIQVDATDAAHGTLDLQNSAIDGGTLVVNGLLDSDGTSFVTGANVTNTGIIDVTSGTLTIDATSTFTNQGKLETNGGNLIVETALSGNLEIKGASTLELGAAESAYANATVTFDAGATGTLLIDQAAHGTGNILTVAGLDDNKIDLANVTFGSNPTASYTGNSSGGVLSVFVNGNDVADIKLTGDYTGVHWTLAQDASTGTTITETPGAIHSGLDANGNAAHGTALTTSVTDGGVAVSGVTYDWQVLSGNQWVNANNSGQVGSASYTPVEADEGLQLRVKLTLTGANGIQDTTTVSAGTVQESTANDLLVTPSTTSPVHDTPVSVTVTDGGTAVSDVSYLWQVFSGGQWVAANNADHTHASYTPTEADEGLQLQVVVTTNANDPTSAETTTQSVGLVGESTINDLLVTPSTTSPVHDTPVSVTVTDGGTAVSNVGYLWQVFSGGQWVAANNADHTHASYTPTEADEGLQLQVVVTTNANDPASAETTTQGIGVVGESATPDLAVTLNTATAAQGAQINVTGVTDGGIAVTGATFQWQVFSNGTWNTVSTASFYAPTEADEGNQLRLVTTYADQPGGNNEQTINSLGKIGDIAPTLITPFNFAIDNLTVVRNGSAIFTDNFGSAPPAGQFGANSFITLGSTWTDPSGAKAVMSSNNAVALPSVNGGQVIARLNTNSQDQSVNDTGLKEGATFTVSATFDLIAPSFKNQQYGIDLNDSSATHPNDDMAQVYVVRDAATGNVMVKLVEANFSTATFTTLDSYTLSAAQLSGNTQIELDLAHPTAGSSAVTGSFELINNGSVTLQHNFAPSTPASVFDNTTYTRADIFAFAPNAVAITGQAQQGQTLTAKTTTNEADATISYEWQKSNDNGTTWTDIGTNSNTYQLQESDEGYQVRVKATTADTDSTQPAATATSVMTAVVVDAPPTIFSAANLQFDGSTLASGPVATSNIGNGSDGVTLDGWVNWSGQGGNGAVETLFYNGNTSTAGSGVFGDVKNGLLDLNVLAGGVTVLDTGITIAAGQWHNVALTHVNGTFTLYLDGTAVYTAQQNVNGLNSSSYMMIGGTADNSGNFLHEGFQGGIADVSVWSTALTQAQIQSTEFSALKGNETKLAAFYPLTGGSGTTVTDATNSAGNLTIHGTPNWQAGNTTPGGEDATISLSGLSNGVAVEHTPITAHLTESDAPSNGIYYTWTVNNKIVHVGLDDAGATYTPTEADEGGTLAVSVAFTDTHGNAETGITSVSIATHGDDPVQAPIINGVAAPSFTTIDVPGDSGTQAVGINDAGIVVGQANATSTHQVGWSYDGTSFTTIVAPNTNDAQDTSAHAINSFGEIVGDYSPARSTPRYGFTDVNGTFTKIASDSPYPSTNANGINNAGVIVGSDYLHSGARYTGYIYSQGVFTYFNVPGTTNANGDTFADDINNQGLIVGTYNSNANNSNGYQGYLYDPTHNTFTTIADPLGTHGTFAQGLNDFGQIVGSYTDAHGVQHGYVDSGGTFITIDDPLGINGTAINGINNSGQVVGYYVDSSGATHGFEASLNEITATIGAPDTLTTLSVSDAAAGNASIQVTLSVGHGALNLGSTTDLTVSGLGSGSVVLTGTQSAIDTALASGVSYATNLTAQGADALTIVANDLGHNPSGTAATTTQQIAIAVHATDDAPVIETDQLQVASSGDNGPTTVTGLKILDPDAGSTETFTLTATTGHPSQSTVSLTSSSGNLDQVNSAISSVTYTPDPTNPPTTDMVNFTVTDNLGHSETVHFVFNQGGNGQNITLTGTSGNDVIFATGGPDTLTGNGGIDQFVFKPTMNVSNPVQHTITDFNANLDTIDLRQFGSGISPSDLLAHHATQQGADTLLTIDSADSILLKNVQTASLHTSDFIVHS
jgi:Laminin G domain